MAEAHGELMQGDDISEGMHIGDLDMNEDKKAVDFEIGDVVRIQNLVNANELNGKLGWIYSDLKRGRHVVYINPVRKMKIRPENLHLELKQKVMPGDLVELHSLSKESANGLAGHIEDLKNSEKGVRFIVRLSALRSLAIRPHNVRLVNVSNECFHRGDRVRLQNLSKEEYNGTETNIIGWDAQKRRHLVLFGDTPISISPDKLELISRGWCHVKEDSTYAQINSVFKHMKYVVVSFTSFKYIHNTYIKIYLDQLCKKYPECTFFSVNIEQMALLANAYRVKVAPTLLYIHNGKQMTRQLKPTPEKINEAIDCMYLGIPWHLRNQKKYNCKKRQTPVNSPQTSPTTHPVAHDEEVLPVTA